MLMLFLQTDSTAINKITENSREFLEVDPIGVGMTAIGMAVVFCSLLLLYIMFMNITKILNWKNRKPAEGEISSIPQTVVSGEVNAAIAYALHMYFKEKHDYEDAILTINKVSRTYSPWSSKIYGLRQNPR